MWKVYVRQIQLLEMKTTLSEVKNPLDGINSKLDVAEENITDFGHCNSWLPKWNTMIKNNSEQWTEHPWAVGQFQVALYRCNWSLPKRKGTWQIFKEIFSKFDENDTDPNLMRTHRSKKLGEPQAQLWASEQRMTPPRMASSLTASRASVTALLVPSVFTLLHLEVFARCSFSFFIFCFFLFISSTSNCSVMS